MLPRGTKGTGRLLAAAFALNAAALFLPFLRMETTFGGTDLYSLPRSVALMWDAKLYAVAALVVLFSVVFPFVKLGALWRVWRGGMDEARAARLVRFVERWGKWSMLDVWIVCLLLALTDDQFFVSTVPLVGLPCFMAAIVAGMLAGELLAARVLPHDPAPVPPRRRWTLLLAGLAHLGAIAVPFLAVDSFWLVDHEVSIVGMARALARSGWPAWAPALGVLAFLVVAPLLSLVARWRGDAGWSARLERYAMLDVFAFALTVFLLEGDEFVPTELVAGAVYLVVATLLFFLLRRASGTRATVVAPDAPAA